MDRTIKVLVVDDEERFATNMVKILQENEVMASAVFSGEAALEELAQNDYDVVLLDVKMPGLNALGTLRAMGEMNVKAKVIILTGHASVDDAVELLNMGAMDYLLKPSKTAKIMKLIHQAVEAKELEEKSLA